MRQCKGQNDSRCLQVMFVLQYCAQFGEFQFGFEQASLQSKGPAANASHLQNPFVVHMSELPQQVLNLSLVLVSQGERMALEPSGQKHCAYVALKDHDMNARRTSGSRVMLRDDSVVGRTWDGCSGGSRERQIHMDVEDGDRRSCVLDADHLPALPRPGTATSRSAHAADETHYSPVRYNSMSSSANQKIEVPVRPRSESSLRQAEAHRFCVDL
jgi:hypothetical protein